MELLAIWWQRSDMEPYGLLLLMACILILLFLDTAAAGWSERSQDPSDEAEPAHGVAQHRDTPEVTKP